MRLLSRSLVVVALLVCGVSGVAQRSPFNGLQVLPADSNGHYRILIGGHFHGESTNRSGYPAATLLANLDTINALGAHLFLSTGDLYMDAAKDSARYARALFSKLKVPFFNAPGNHDKRGRGEIVRFELPFRGPFLGETGETAFEPRSNLVLNLDCEELNGSISSKGLAEFASIATDSTSGVDRVFIVAHRPVWAEGDPQYSDLFIDNTRSLLGTNFHKEVYPILQEIAKHAHVYWISGSLGGQAPSSIFFQEHVPNITYIQCAVRDEPRDALLIADVYPDSVHWSALSLTGQELKAPATYDAAWWRSQRGAGDGFNWRLVPYLLRKTVTAAAFWWGVLAALVLAWLVRRLLWR